MTIFDYIATCCKNKTCFKCNGKMVKATKENIIDMALNPIVCKKCDIEYSIENYYGPFVRFRYKIFIVGYNENGGDSNREYQVFYDNGLDSNSFFALYSYEKEFQKLQTMSQLYEHLDKLVKETIFK